MKWPMFRSACTLCALLSSVLVLSGWSAPVGASSTRYTWPQFHHDPSLSGASADPTITSANASSLGVHWMSEVGGTEGSPVVAWNASLGQTLAYVGDTDGYLNAVNADSGAIVWSDPFGSSFTATPLVSGSSVWAAPVASGRIYKLDAATGAVECTIKEVGSIQSSPVVATLPGGQTLVYFATLDTGGGDGSVYAINTYSCATVFTWSGNSAFSTKAGIWSPLSYGVAAGGVPLLLFGSADPDSSEYAINAATGQFVWRYQTSNPPGEDWDVGAGSTISAPGVNGFADGVAYFDGKDGVFYALDLLTGALLWSWDFGGGTNTDALSTPALDGSKLVFGDNAGVYALDAISGSVLWHYSTGGDTVNSSPAIVGPPGQRVVAFGTLGGVVHVVSLWSGASLYSYQTGSFITASPADYDGTLLIDSNDGFLYDFGLGGGNGAAPTTAVTAPANGSTVAYPSGPLTISGTATAPDGVKAVTVAVQEGGSAGPWYKATTDTFTPGLSLTEASLGSPGAVTSTWNLQIPVPEQGASYLVEASSVDEDGIADISSGTGKTAASVSSFTVEASPTAPVVTPAEAWVPPGGPLTVSATGFESGEGVTFTLPVSGGGSEVLGTATASASGSAGPVTGAVPTNEPFGPQTLLATGASSGRVGAAVVTVANSSPQLGYGPQRLGFEDNDGVISRHQAVGASYFSQAWTVSAGSAISSPPAVVDGVAYFGDAAGVFHAVTVANGQSLWTASIGSGITSSPAVDGGSVYLGDDAGNVVALNATTGATEWSSALGSSISSSPAISGGVVFVATSAGTLDALNELTGHTEWRHSLGAPTAASPSVDPGADVVVIGDQSGTVHALSTTNGQPLWHHATGQPVAAPATFDDSYVLVGTEKGTLYALDEATGARAWWHATGGPITSAPVVTHGGDVGVGSGDGNVYDYLMPSGKLDSTQPVGAPVDGLTGTDGIYIVATPAGLSLLRGAGGTRVDWHYARSDTFESPVVILNGEVFAAGSDGVLRVFVIPGNSVY